jgi:hypothetical protein
VTLRRCPRTAEQQRENNCRVSQSYSASSHVGRLLTRGIVLYLRPRK